MIPVIRVMPFPCHPPPTLKEMSLSLSKRSDFTLEGKHGRVQDREGLRYALIQQRGNTERDPDISTWKLFFCSVNLVSDF